MVGASSVLYQPLTKNMNTEDTEDYIPNEPIIMDEEDELKDAVHQARRETAQRATEYIYGLINCLLKFKGDARLAIKSVAAAHGMWATLKERDQSEIADHYGCTRANVNKLVTTIQGRLQLPPMLGQRPMEGREKMRTTRKKQLKAK